MYERFFGLVDAPFRLTPDPRYLFLSRKHADALAHLKLGLTESSGFVCITGDVGTGKTTLLRAFLAGLGPEVTTAYIFNPALSALELLRTINAELGLAATSRSRKRLADALNGHLLAQREAGGRSVVIVDEAQALSVEVLEELRLLSNLETTTEKLLRIVLVGQPQLRALLLHPSLVQLNQRITLRWHLGPLTSRETRAYVAHRLALASRGRPGRVFTRPALWLVSRFSGGIPRLVNMIAHRAMLAAFAADSRRVGARSVVRASRELGTVPLPPAKAPPRRWAALAGGACLGMLALGAARFAGMPGTATEPTQTSALAPAVTAPAPDPVEHLATASTEASARAAVAALLVAWAAPPLAPGEAATPAQLDAVARRRGLESLPLAGSSSVLRLLDLPAVLELRLGAAREPRYATLVAAGDEGWRLVIGEQPATVDGGFLERHWFGRAHVFWRDFESLGPALLGPQASGPAVVRLQALLRRAGAYRGAETGEYDPPTAAAVLEFQRAHLLHTDARVGPLTRILLYAAAAGYPQPTLGAGSDGTS